MDRGGLVGADGATHGGAFDITYMACLPNMVVMAPSNEAELIHMVATSAAIDDRPSCFRYMFQQFDMPNMVSGTRSSNLTCQTCFQLHVPAVWHANHGFSYMFQQFHTPNMVADFND